VRKLLPALFATAAAWTASAWASLRIPERVPVHWNLRGEVDGWGSPAIVLWLIPALMLADLFLFWAIPKIDPRRASWDRHDSAYWTIVTGLNVFMLAVHLAVLGASLGWTTRTGQWIPVAVGLLGAFIGNVLTRIRPNFFVGYRTPWALSSDENWRRTHRVAGPSFVVGGLALALSGAIGFPFLAAGAVCFLAATIYPAVYSWRLWKGEQAAGVAGQ
jgi:uncharacterized membrane protein